MLCNCQALVMGGSYRCCSKYEGCSSADDFDYYEETPSVKVTTNVGICGKQVPNTFNYFNCMDKIEKREVTCEQIVRGSSYRCCLELDDDCRSMPDYYSRIWTSCETGCVPSQ